MARMPYSSDLTDEQWEILSNHIPPAKPGGRPRSTDMREVLNSLLYQNRTGCQWDMLPHDLLPKSTVHGRCAERASRGGLAKSFLALVESGSGAA